MNYILDLCCQHPNIEWPSPFPPRKVVQLLGPVAMRSHLHGVGALLRLWSQMTRFSFVLMCFVTACWPPSCFVDKCLAAAPDLRTHLQSPRKFLKSTPPACVLRMPTTHWRLVAVGDAKHTTPYTLYAGPRTHALYVLLGRIPSPKKSLRKRFLLPPLGH